jgi:hypothetical protein
MYRMRKEEGEKRGFIPSIFLTSAPIALSLEEINACNSFKSVLYNIYIHMHAWEKRYWWGSQKEGDH